MSDEELKSFYERGLTILRQHHEEICVRVMKSRKEGKGNFGYLEDEQIKRERILAKILQHLLWRIYLSFKGREKEVGCCDQKCIDCCYPRYHFHSKKEPDHWCNEKSEGWYCQVECECK